MGVGFRVAELRAAKGWTQQELSNRAGVSRATVLRLEGEPAPTRVDVRVLEKLARAFGVEPGYLLAPERPTRRGKAS